MSLVEFLTARLNEREEAAREAVPRRWFSTDNYLDDVNDGTVARFEIKADARHAALHDPARVLAEVAAQRRIVDAQTGGGACQGHLKSWQPHGDYRQHGSGYCRDYDGDEILRLLALPDADHPDYREEWTP